MLYAVNQITKEHKIINNMNETPQGLWRVAEADKHGWIKWDACYGAKSPISGKHGEVAADIKLNNGQIVDVVANWDDSPAEPCRVHSYRPCIKGTTLRYLMLPTDATEEMIDSVPLTYAADAVWRQMASHAPKYQASMPSKHDVPSAYSHGSDPLAWLAGYRQAIKDLT